MNVFNYTGKVLRVHYRFSQCLHHAHVSSVSESCCFWHRCTSKLCKYKHFRCSSAAHVAVWCHGRLNSYNTVKASLALGAGTVLITTSSPWQNLILSGSLRLICPVFFYSLSALKHPQLRNTNSISSKCFPK